MKNNLILIACFMLCINNLMAQSQRAFSYQAIARNTSGSPVTNQSVMVQFSIRDSVVNGPVIYQESSMLNTNSLGLFNTAVGSGNAIIGNFSTINWGGNQKFLQVEIDISGGINLVDMGTTELLSVPYAQYATVAENALNYTEIDGDIYNEIQQLSQLGNTIQLSRGGGSFDLNTYAAGSGIDISSSNVISTTTGHYIGEMFGGGIVFHVYKDASGVEHGLIASLSTLTFSAPWSNVTSTTIPFVDQRYSEGQENTTAIINQAGHTSSAALLCENYSNGGFNDWYLPASYELSLLYQNVYTVNKALDNDNDPLTARVGVTYYWSSTESSATNAYYLDFYNGTLNHLGNACLKSYSNAVRAIRAF